VISRVSFWTCTRTVRSGVSQLDPKTSWRAGNCCWSAGGNMKKREHSWTPAHFWSLAAQIQAGLLVGPVNQQLRFQSIRHMAWVATVVYQNPNSEKKNNDGLLWLRSRPLLDQAAVEYIPNHAEGVVHQSKGSFLRADDLSISCRCYSTLTKE
jgi:hypothetical protein